MKHLFTSLRKKIKHLMFIVVLVFTQNTSAQTLIANYPLTTNMNDATGYNPPMNDKGAAILPPSALCGNGSANTSNVFAYTPNINSLNQNWFEFDVDFSLNGYTFSNPYHPMPIMVIGGSYRWLSLEVNASGYLVIKYNNSSASTTNKIVNLNTWYTAKMQVKNGRVNLLINGVSVTNGFCLGSLATGNDYSFLTSDQSTGNTLNGCIKNLKINNNPSVTMANTGTQNASVCSGGSFTFPDGTTTTNITSTVNHTSYLTTSAGCDSVVNSTISVTPLPNVTISPSSVSTCYGTPVNLVASGASTYTWSPSSGLSATTGSSVNSNPVSTTTYTVTGTTSGCSGSKTVTVTVNPTPSPSISGSSTICAGSGTTLTASGGSTYSWSPATGLSSTTGSSVTATPGSSIVYTLTAFIGSCSSSTTINISVTPLPNISVSGTSTICSGSSTSLTASGASSYTWSPSTGLSATSGASVNANPTASTVYTITGTISGCSNSTTKSITVNPLPTINISGTSTICSGSSTTLTASGGTSYSWAPTTGLSPTSGASVSASPTSSLTYTVTGTSGGCSNIATIPINVTALPTISVSGTSTICSGSSTTLTASGGTTYTWAPSTALSATSGTSVTANPTSTITYTVTGTTSGCSGNTTKQITVTALPSITVSGTSTICSGSSTTLTASGGTTYTWAPSTDLSATSGVSVTANPSSSTTYTITGTSSGCSVTTTKAITVNASPTISVSGTSTICQGSSTVLTASGATSYSWSPSIGLSATTGASVTASSTSPFTATSTIYTVTGTSAGCTGSQTFTVTVNNNPIITTSTINDICEGTSTTIAAYGGVNYSWAPATGLSSTVGPMVKANPSTTTTYTITASYLNGCISSITKQLTVIPAPVITISNSTSICRGSSTTITASGTDTYTWSPSTGLSGTSGSSVTASPTSTKTYTVTGTNTTTSCTNTNTVTVTVLALPVVSISGTSSICNGSSTTLTASGATTYSWAPPTGLSNTVANLVGASPTTTTTYTVTGTNTSTTCSNTQTITVTVNPMPTITIGAVTDPPACGANGSIEILGSATGTINWSGTSTGNSGLVTLPYTITLAEGAYNFQFTNTDGCASAVVTRAIYGPSSTIPSITTSGSATICSGGSVTLTSSQASGNVWSTGATSPSITVTNAGSYTVTYTGPNGCSGTSNAITVVVNPTPIINITGTTTICDNGSTTLNASGAATYNWAPSTGLSASIGSSTTAAPASSITYTVTGTSGGCSGSNTINITVNPTPKFTITATNVNCHGANNGSATTNITSGTPNYNYSWSPSGGSSSTASGLSPGNYTCTITDANNCSGTQSTLITEPAALSTTLSASSDVNCFGTSTGSATISVSGGTSPYSYNWLPSGGTAATASNLAAGTYTCNIKDANNCPGNQVIAINEPTALTSAISSQTNVTCNGGNTGTITVNASGGRTPYTYLWTPAGGTAATANNLVAGNYTCTATDSKGCVATVSAIVTEPTALSATNTTTASTCGNSNGTATAAVSGGTSPYSYNWAPSGGTSNIANGLVAGTYVCTIKDANNCSATTTAIITNSNGATISLTATNVNCFGGNTGSLTANVNGGTSPYTYSWSNGQNSSSISNLTAGSYTCTVKDANNCISTQIGLVTEPAALTGNIVSQTNVKCNGGNNGSVTINASGGTTPYTYAWTPTGGTNSTASSLVAGNYTCAITDGKGCIGSLTVSLTEPVILSSTFTSTNASCGQANGASTITVAGGTSPYTYSWSPSGGSSNTASGLVAGTYVCTVTDANNCSKATTITITSSNGPTLQLSATNLNCFGTSTGSISSVISGGSTPFSYSWSPSGGTASVANNLAAGTYTCTVTDAKGCTSTQTASVSSPAALIVNCNSTPSCGTGTGNATASVTGGTLPYTYAWTPNTYTGDNINNLNAGTYNCIVADAKGCTASKSVTVVTNPLPIVNAGNDVSIIIGNSVNLSSTAGVKYQWTPSTFLSCNNCQNPIATPIANTEYCVEITDANNCKSTDCVNITVENDCGQLFVPNAFSPNNDGTNDLLCIYGKCLRTIDFAIFDRWGEKVFETNNIKACWDGTYKGEYLNTAVFFYVLNAEMLNGETITKKGNINLVK